MKSKIDDLTLTREKAVIVDDTAIIADLHLGIESMMEDYGVTFPRVQIREVINNITSIVENHGINRLVVAGDLKHEFGKNKPYEWEDVELFLKKFSDLEIEVVRGNHDNFLMTILSKYGVEMKSTVKVSGWTVTHGHKYIEAEKMIMGHEHPTIKVRESGAIYKYPCFLHVRERNAVVLPAFSPVAQGSDVLSAEKFLSPILDVEVDNVEIYAVEDEVVYLGSVYDVKRALRAR
ncbi:MAG: metallophosphoesterase [Archaeoglobaceae archaeon]